MYILNIPHYKRTTSDSLVLFFTDPIGSINNKIRRITGWKTHLEAHLALVDPNYYRNSAAKNDRPNEHLTSFKNEYIGMHITLTW